MNRLPTHCVIFYHYIRNAPRYKVHALSVDSFERQVDFLLDNMPPLDPDEVIRCIETRKSIRKGFLLTFDDGFKEHYDVVYKCLKAKGLRGIFFPNILPYINSKVPFANQLQVLVGNMESERLIELIMHILSERFPRFSFNGLPKAPHFIKRMDNNRINDLKYFLNFTLPRKISQDLINDIFNQYIMDTGSFILENFLTVEQIKEMADNGMVFGGHTVTHPYLTSCDKDIKQKEILDSINFIEDITGSKSYFFCYPYGHYDGGCIEILKNSGVEVAFTTAPDNNFNYKNKFNVGRYDTVLLPPVSKFKISDLRFIETLKNIFQDGKYIL
jgi:peptidoglycan/xylan/chitin deacetylase (PgdA/CDA1 family)